MHGPIRIRLTMKTTNQQNHKQETNSLLHAPGAYFTKISTLYHHKAARLWLLKDAIGTRLKLVSLHACTLRNAYLNFCLLPAPRVKNFSNEIFYTFVIFLMGVHYLVCIIINLKPSQETMKGPLAWIW